MIADERGEELLVETFAHDENGIGALCAALACFEVEVVAIERHALLTANNNRDRQETREPVTV